MQTIGKGTLSVGFGIGLLTGLAGMYMAKEVDRKEFDAKLPEAVKILRDNNNGKGFLGEKEAMRFVDINSNDLLSAEELLLAQDAITSLQTLGKNSSASVKNIIATINELKRKGRERGELE